MDARSLSSRGSDGTLGEHGALIERSCSLWKRRDDVMRGETWGENQEDESDVTADT